jgi:hypothetical protein
MVFAAWALTVDTTGLVTFDAKTECATFQALYRSDYAKLGAVMIGSLRDDLPVVCSFGSVLCFGRRLVDFQGG